MYIQICIGLCLGWNIIYEMLKRTVFPKFLQHKVELEMEFLIVFDETGLNFVKLI